MYVTGNCETKINYAGHAGMYVTGSCETKTNYAGHARMYVTGNCETKTNYGDYYFFLATLAEIMKKLSVTPVYEVTDETYIYKYLKSLP